LSQGIDSAGNVVTSTPTSGGSLTVDNTKPTAGIAYSAPGPYRQGVSITITATFSETMADSPVPQIAISAVPGGTATAATNMTKVDSTHYTYAYTVQGGTGTANVTMSTGTDLLGNVVTSVPTSGGSFTVDNTPPTISFTGPTPTITDSAFVIYTVTYSEGTVTLQASDITVNSTGPAAAALVTVTPVIATTRTVTLSTITGDGTLSISIGAGTAVDAAGNTAAAAGPSATVTVDNTKPVTASVTNPVDGTNFAAGTGPSGPFTCSAADNT